MHGRCAETTAEPWHSGSLTGSVGCKAHLRRHCLRLRTPYALDRLALGIAPLDESLERSNS
jgi:hypothetical protein